MALNRSKGNMYDFVTHTWNPVKGVCYHNCSYCYMTAMRKRFNKEEKHPYLEEKELNTNLGSGNFIFVGSGNDLFCESYPVEWITKTLDHCAKFPDNKYLFQSKNPRRIIDFMTHPVFSKVVICTTIESDSFFPDHMGMAPHSMQRSLDMGIISEYIPTYVTIEPIMDFHEEHLIKMIKRCHPVQVNIGADSGRNNLPEPSAHEIRRLIFRLEEFTSVKLKSNLKRLLKQ